MNVAGRCLNVAVYSQPATKSRNVDFTQRSQFHRIQERSGRPMQSREGSSAFVFDMMEPERPKVDRAIVEFVKAHKFHAADFVIRSDGVCRLNPEMARVVVFMVGTDQALDMMATPMTNTNTLSG